MRRLATVRQIADIRPIEGADKIVVAQVDGWECVIQKDEFNIGDKVVYVEVDSIMPEKPEYEFLRKRKFRVKTIKLRGQISQGLVLPMSVLPNGRTYELDDDVTDVLGVKKYDPQAEQEQALLAAKNKKKHGKLFGFMCRFAWFRKLALGPKKNGGFPDWIVKTDEERIQNKTIMFEQERGQVHTSPRRRRSMASPAHSSFVRLGERSMSSVSVPEMFALASQTEALTGRWRGSMTLKKCFAL